MDEGPSRKLAVLLHADVVGSTALVRLNETLAHQRIRGAFKQFSETIVSYNGIAHEVRGDALVAEFSKASDAVTAALEFQNANATHNDELPDEIQPVVRVGIAMGEVLVADNTVTGEGIVLAQRLEQLAVPGGVCIQDAAYQTVPKRLPFAYEYLGEQSLKGFDDPVRAYAVLPGAGITRSLPISDAEHKPDLQLPEKPSIAVLPFTNMSGDPEQEYFSDGITEDIITELSRSAKLFVIARSSSFQFKGGGVDLAEVGRKLGVRYVVEGSVRKAGRRVRITAQLIEAATGSHVWAERYDRDLEDIFAVQDEVTERIVWALAGRVEMAEIARSRRQPMENLDAYELVLRAAGLINNRRYTRDSVVEALRLIKQAAALEPGSGRILSWLAYVYIFVGFMVDQRGFVLAIENADRALVLGGAEDWTDAVAAYAIGWHRNADTAEVRLAMAMAKNPNDSFTLQVNAFVLLWQGRALEASAVGKKLARLDPYDPVWYDELFGYTHYLLGNYEESVRSFERGMPLAYYRSCSNLAAGLGQLGRVQEAKASWRRCLELRPGFTLDEYDRESPYARPEDREHWLDGLRKAGIPE